ncbi:CDP-glycerol glycerophosphotransferase family protein [Glutamicibacter sp. NPDC087344]|uniref:CDP-glycerol glycerophosphotransferase family protein n=1 Tax=Glutamicibacter sp. NPDC087344 TaxID=3363994 RepID=UPI003800821E
MKVLKSWNRAANFAKRRLSMRRSQKAIAQNAAELFHAPTGDDRYRVAVYFADEMVNAYQIRQWYEPLSALTQDAPTVVITRKPGTALALREECPLPVFYAPTIGDLEALVSSQAFDIVFYVNQNIQNFQMMRFNNPNHVFLCHGESDKSYMWTNQLKAYDFVFSAGQAARDRLAEHLHNFDVEQRTKLVGRPQIDVSYPSPLKLDNSRPTILYAPTWEGDRPTMHYGSAMSHGDKLIEALLANEQFNIIFRPHPRSGASSPAYGQAVRQLKIRLEQAAKTSSAVIYFDDSSNWGWQWTAADLCITDISAAAYDFLATGKPLFLTKPSSQGAEIANSRALSQIPALSTGHASNVAEYINEALQSKNDDTKDLVNYYFGDITPGASLARFVSATKELLGSSHQDSTVLPVAPSADTDLTIAGSGLAAPCPVHPRRAA